MKSVNLVSSELPDASLTTFKYSALEQNRLKGKQQMKQAD